MGGAGLDDHTATRVGTARCPRCSAPLSKDLVASNWTIPPFMRESFAMVALLFIAVVGAAAGGGVSAFYGFNMIMPYVSKWVRGPMRNQFLAGLPPVLLFSVGCAGLSGGALSALAQLAASTYYMAEASSHSAISNITRGIEGRRQGFPSFATQLHQSDSSVAAHSAPTSSSIDKI